MEKKNLILTCMAIPGGILFSVGMVLALLTEWGMFIPGIIIGAIGLIILVAIYPVYRRVAGYPKLERNPKIILVYVIGIFFTLLLGTGMALIMAMPTPKTWQIIVGMLVGIIGLIGVILNLVINLSMQKNKNGN